jgi:hypothetical protein
MRKKFCFITCGVPSRRWEDNIKTGLREIGHESVDLFYLTRDRNWCRTLVNIVMKLWVP